MIELKGITVTFQDKSFKALDNLNLTLKQGEFCILIGSNGSGKSTLLKTISKEYILDEGQIITPRFSLVSQDINKGTITEMSCLENMVLSYIKYKGAGFNFYSKYEQKMIEIIKELGIGMENNIHKPLASLSGGQRQMIATLMAFISEPELLLLDEHTSALDPKIQKKLMEYTLVNILKNGVTTIMVTHKLEDAINYGNRLIMLHKGRIYKDYNEEEKRNLTIDELFQLFHECEVENV